MGKMAMAAAENRRGGRVKGMFNVSCLSVSVSLIFSAGVLMYLCVFCVLCSNLTSCTAVLIISHGHNSAGWCGCTTVDILVGSVQA